MEEIKNKKILILVNTYFQIITAVKLKLTMYKNDDVDIIISNHSEDSYKIYKSLKDIKIFNEVYYFESKEKNKNKIKKMYDNFSFLLFPEKNLKKQKIQLGYYDEYIFYNVNKYSYIIYDTIYNKNNNIKAIRFEEGYISYLYINIGISNIYKKIRKILKKPFLEETINLHIFYT